MENEIPILPTELYEIILSKITDTETYKNTRLVCKLFNKIFKNIVIFENNLVKETIIFDEYFISILDKNNNEIAYFNKITQTFESKNIKINLSNPYKITIKKYTPTTIENTTINLLTDKKTTNIINLPIAPICIIS